MTPDTPKLSRQDLYNIAVYQKAIQVCILVYFLAVLAQFVLPAEVRLFVGVSVLGIGVVATVFVILLALKMYSTGMGIFLAILTFIPCIGLITLLVINQKATGTLTKNGYRVGLLGANLSQFKE